MWWLTNTCGFWFNGNRDSQQNDTHYFLFIQHRFIKQVGLYLVSFFSLISFPLWPFHFARETKNAFFVDVEFLSSISGMSPQNPFCWEHDHQVYAPFPDIHIFKHMIYFTFSPMCSNISFPPLYDWFIHFMHLLVECSLEFPLTLIFNPWPFFLFYYDDF